MKPASQRAFSLLEVVVVAGLIAGVSAWSWWRMHDGSAMALQAGQTLVWEALALARSTSIARGLDCRLLVNVELNSARARQRYLRRVAVQVQKEAGWSTIFVRDLPPGVGILPRSPEMVAGLLAPGTVWTRGDGSLLRSSSLRVASETRTAVTDGTAEAWACIAFSPTGTTGESGDLVLGVLRPLAPGQTVSPVQFVHSGKVRGVTISAYGLVTLVNQRSAF